MDKRLFDRLIKESEKSNINLENQIVNLLESHFSIDHRDAPVCLDEIKKRVRKSQDASVLKEYLDVFQNDESEGRGGEYIKQFFGKIPCVQGVVFVNINSWYIKLDFDLNSKIVWNVIQELSFVLNNLSLLKKLPVIFKPISPPPYLNGGPERFLSWIIEPTSQGVDPTIIISTLAMYLPTQIENEKAWIHTLDEQNR